MSDRASAGDRLRKARRDAGLSVEQVAQRTGYSASGVRAIENGQNGLRPDAAERFAPVLGVTAAWLLTGDGDAAVSRLVRIIGTAGADVEGRLIQSMADDDYDTVPAPPSGDPDAVAVWIQGDSMRVLAPDGSLVYFRDQRNPPTPDMIGYNCVVELEDGRVLFKRLLRGSEPNTYMLESHVGAPIDNVRLRWAAEPVAIIPPKEARRIVRKAGVSQVA